MTLIIRSQNSVSDSNANAVGMSDASLAGLSLHKDQNTLGATGKNLIPVLSGNGGGGVVDLPPSRKVQ
jgi:formate/nitrite transporter FocA (FNT family)